MKKIILICTCCLATLFSAKAQPETECSFYIKFKGKEKNFATLRKAPGMQKGTRRIKSELLFPIQTRANITGLEAMTDYAFSLHVGEALQNSYRIDFEGVTDAGELFNRLKAMPDVIAVERVEAVEIFTSESTGNMPDDPLLKLTDVNGAWHLKQIGFDKIYGKYQGNPEVKVAVIDNAVWGSHPDLQVKPENQYFAYIDEEGSSNPPSAMDQETVCEEILRCPISEWSHGTHCAGLVAAISNNGEGVASFASGVTLLTARTADIDPRRMLKAFEGVCWAIDKGADLLSLSWGSPRPSSFEEEVILEAIKQNIIVVAAAGNDGLEAKTYPAAYEGVIAVGAVDSDNTRSSFSNYGDWVTIGAPGGFLKDQNGKKTANVLLSTTYSISQLYRVDGLHEIDGMFYDGKAGTSMATPLVASVIGLMLSINPDLTPGEITTILQETATKTASTNFSPEGGVIDAAKAIETVSKMTNIKQVTNNEILFYPNPATDFIEINTNEPIEEIVVTDLVGTVLIQKPDVMHNRINIATLPHGVYMIRVRIEERMYLAKFIKE